MTQPPPDGRLKSVQKRSKIWELRCNQQIEECRAQTSKLALRLGLTAAWEELERLPGELIPRWRPNWPWWPPPLRGWMASMNAPEISSVAIERFHAARSLGPTFQLTFQRALNLTVQSDWSRALELLLVATERAKDDWERLFAMGNTLLCLENLGLPLERTRAEIGALAKKTSAAPKFRGS